MAETYTLYKLIVLYMLERVDFPLTTSQISDFILDKGYTSYFKLQEILSELTESDLLKVETTHNRTLYHLTENGEETIHFFSNKISPAIRQEIDDFLKEKRYDLKEEVSVKSDYYLNTNHEFEVRCQIVENGYSLIDLMVGSEGTLGILTKLTVKLIPEPKANVSLLIPFEHLEACIQAVPEVLACGCEPTAVEFMEREVIACAETYLGKQFPDASSDAYLLVRLDGASPEALRPMVDRLTDVALELGAQDVLLADTDERKESIWNARGAFLEAIKGSTPNMDECDVVVPRDRIAAFVKHSVSIGREEGVRICSFGHAGDGNLHLYICQDGLKDAVWTDVVERVMERLYAQARELGGEVSGEHGIGHAKRAYLLESAGERQIDLMRGIKAVFDPNGILNPGKVL